ncbi:MAG: hypothetical protein WA654_13800, partial [Candidatus Sulfotelmatobacter sp.]
NRGDFFRSFSQIKSEEAGGALRVRFRSNPGQLRNEIIRDGNLFCGLNGQGSSGATRIHTYLSRGDAGLPKFVAYRRQQDGIWVRAFQIAPGVFLNSQTSGNVISRFNLGHEEHRFRVRQVNQ